MTRKTIKDKEILFGLVSTGTMTEAKQNGRTKKLCFDTGNGVNKLYHVPLITKHVEWLTTAVIK